MRKGLAFIALAAFMLLGIAQANAMQAPPPDTILSYTLTPLNGSSFDGNITDLVHLTGYDYTPISTVIPSTGGTVVDPVAKPRSYLSMAMLVGLTTDVYNQTHIVLTANTAALPSLVGVSFNDAFLGNPYGSEAAMITALKTKDYTLLPDFFMAALPYGLDLMIPPGITGPIALQDFSLVQFSEGKEVGKGTTQASPVPLPGVVWLLGGGLLGVLGARRKLTK